MKIDHHITDEIMETDELNNNNVSGVDVPLPKGTILTYRYKVREIEIKDTYEVIKELSTGGFGRTYLCRRLGADNGISVVIKEFCPHPQEITRKSDLELVINYEKNKTAFEDFKKEPKRINTLKNEAGKRNPQYPQKEWEKLNLVIPQTEVFTDHHNFYYVMEYVDGCTLEDLIHSGKKFPEDVVAGWFIQICRAIVYLHSLTPPIVYRDFKPSNIMLDRNGTIRIIDLGIAQEYRTPRIGRQANALTRGYAAPEQYNSRYSLDVRTDLYAVAVTIHYLLTGKDPNQPPYHFRPVRKLNPRVSLAMESIVKRCLQPNPDKRYPTAALLLEDLTHRDRLEQQLLTRRRWRAILIAVLTALALVGAALAFTISRTAREAEITAYYEYLDQADAASSMEKSLALLQQAVESDPDNPDAYLAIAALYLRQGLREESARYLQEEILPRFPDIYQNEAFLELVGELDTAD